MDVSMNELCVGVMRRKTKGEGVREKLTEKKAGARVTDVVHSAAPAGARGTPLEASTKQETNKLPSRISQVLARFGQSAALLASPATSSATWRGRVILRADILHFLLWHSGVGSCWLAYHQSRRCDG